MTKAKPFQKVTVEHAMRAFSNQTGSRRFLVADEVGLGKTVVAQHVIHNLMKGRKEPLVVFYVCSNLSIASQNQKKLLEVLPEKNRDSAKCPVDRLTLMPASDPPTNHQLHLYVLTPDTSIPMRTGRRRDGRQSERALIQALVEQTWPELLNELDRKFFRRSAVKWWSEVLKRQRTKVTPILKNVFLRSVRTEFGLEPRMRLIPALRGKDPLDLIAHFRNALAACAIEEVRPDLVIFDEFQRFRDLTSPDLDSAAERVIGALRGDRQNHARPALLLLSATPYQMFSRRWEDAAGKSHHAEFFELVFFLWGGDEAARQKKIECEEAFSELERELRKGKLSSSVAHAAREKIQTILRPIIARTERASHSDGWANSPTLLLPSELKPIDLKVFRHLNESFEDRHRPSSVPYWSSIPLPMQTMGPRYIAWKDARYANPNGAPVFRQRQRDRFETYNTWPHPKFRALRDFLSTERLALPWLCPSLPWWPLKGNWKKQGPEKMLVFSRFRAVPPAVASFLSYDLESTLLSKSNIPYKDIPKRRLLQAKDNRLQILSIFYPSPWLVSVTDPLASEQKSLAGIRKHILQQVHKAISKLGVPIRVEGKPRPTWMLMGRLETLAGYWPWVHETWRAIHQRSQRQGDTERGMGQLLSRWDEEAQRPLEYLTHREVDKIADYALSAPGIVLGRALMRHWDAAVSQNGFEYTLQASWNGLRTYLDQRWFVEALKGNDIKYPKMIQKAVLEGNLEALLDEHFWIIRKTQNVDGTELAHELRNALSIRSSVHRLHVLGQRKQDGFSLRCHVAMPFTEVKLATEEGEVSDRPLRTDEIRRAFNSPFWPHILVTTSVGQEGLDFHVWCKNLVHWDLCSNPVDLEQREGRIQRFGGLATRKVIASHLGSEVLANLHHHESPWIKLERLADERLSDNSGLCPWWVYKGADIQRFVFNLPLSEQVFRLEWMKEQRLLYRFLLGQPNQEDLIDIMLQHTDVTIDDVRKSTIGLSPWFHK